MCHDRFVCSAHPLVVVFGTRPEAIKLAPVIAALRETGLPNCVVVTGQHRELVEDVLRVFDITPDVDLAIMRPGQTLDHVLAASVEGVGRALDRLTPSGVIVQGDTTSMLGASIAAFHRRIPVAHVEAGLRSGSLELPFPEEMNRRVASLVSRWHFAPTTIAAANLEREGITSGVYTVGNTIVDALNRIITGPDQLPAPITSFLGDAPYVLATAHRRESWGDPIASIARALRRVIHDRPDHRLVFVTHPNPRARGRVDELLRDTERTLVLDAVPYPTFIRLLAGAEVAVSDSGGVQEEGPTLGVPVLVTRVITERPEGLAVGAAMLVGTDEDTITRETLDILTNPERRRAMSAAGHWLYGDGRAAQRIVAQLATDLRA
jgi:UDP-N-acetylglucosamine 2-epimerase (non-hydrolysing)